MLYNIFTVEMVAERIWPSTCEDAFADLHARSAYVSTRVTDDNVPFHAGCAPEYPISFRSPHNTPHVSQTE